MPSISILADDEAGVWSPVSSATTAAPMESATNKMPSGPKASGPADWRLALPALSVATGLAGWRALTPMATAAVTDRITASVIQIFRDDFRRIESPSMAIRAYAPV